MLRLAETTDYALITMTHLASDPGCIVRDPLRRIRDRIAAVLAECSIVEIVANPEPSAPPVRVITLPAMRCVTAL